MAGSCSGSPTYDKVIVSNVNCRVTQKLNFKKVCAEVHMAKVSMIHPQVVNPLSVFRDIQSYMFRSPNSSTEAIKEIQKREFRICTRNTCLHPLARGTSVANSTCIGQVTKRKKAKSSHTNSSRKIRFQRIHFLPEFMKTYLSIQYSKAIK